MNLGFTPEHDALRAEFARLLAAGDRRTALVDRPPGVPADGVLWRELAQGGWLAGALPESCGGSALDARALCVLAEEAGRALVAVPFVASACAFTYGLGLADPGGAVARELGPALVCGEARGALLTQDCWPQPPVLACDEFGQWRLNGRARQVPDGASASHALCCVGDGEQSCLLLLRVTPEANATQTAATAALDLLHPCCDLPFVAREPRVIARGADAQQRWRAICDAQAVFVAFEQLGGAEATLQAARRYSLQRYAFGRPIGSFQALKHLMADMLVAIDLARSNCLFGAAALQAGGSALAEAAAVARISATDAFRLCAAGSTQVHGALGVTWEADCHLYYRRAQALAGNPDSLWSWKQRLVELLLQRRAAPA